MSKFKSNNSIGIMNTGSIRFDFGQTNAAWLEFDAIDMPDSIALSISEYNEPAIVNQGAINRFKTLAPVKHGNLYRLELNPELYEGVRFGWLHILGHKRKWEIKNLRLVCQIKPVNYLGSFASNDSQLNKIWYTGAYTVKLNLMKDYFGAILMERSDRHSWTGDAYPSQACSLVAFGNYDMVKTNLIHTATLDNAIPSYSLYWVLSLIDYVNYSGDTTFGVQYMNNATKKLDKAFAMFDDPKDLNFYGWDERLGAGFENATNPETKQAYQFLAIRCWAAFSKLASSLRREKVGVRYALYASEKMKMLRADKKWLSNAGLHASADAINTGLTNDTENKLLYNKNFRSRVNRLSYSPFNEYFIMQSLACMNQYEDAISTIKDCWGGQLDYGGTTFFEVYRPSWNTILGKNSAPVNNQCGYTSLTHPWSSGVTQWLSQEVLGIKPVIPGFKKFNITPHLGGVLNWIKGTMPTPHGPISVAINQRTGINKFSIPKGTQAETITLTLTGVLKEIYLNNKMMWKQGGPTPRHVLLTDSNLIFKQLASGDYSYRLVYASRKAFKTKSQPQWDYLIKHFKQDSTTGGNWHSKFGKQGFLLFNSLDKGKNMEQLPAFISRVTLKNQADVNIKAAQQTTGVLTDTSGYIGQLGAIITQDPLACLQTMTIDIEAADSLEHQLSIYLLDWDNQQRRTAIEVFELKSFNLLAPVQLVQHYQKGKYLTFKFNGSVRLRINQVRGPNAATSGLFFD